jgi:hypothetical protein
MAALWRSFLHGVLRVVLGKRLFGWDVVISALSDHTDSCFILVRCGRTYATGVNNWAVRECLPPESHATRSGTSEVKFNLVSYLVASVLTLFNYRVTVVLLPLLTFAIYLPSLFRYEVVKCVLFADGSITYYKRDNSEFLQTMFYSVSGGWLSIWVRVLLIFVGCRVKLLMIQALKSSGVRFDWVSLLRWFCH